MPKHQIPLHKIYQELFHHFGPQGWWPGDTPFEIMIGAILTQNTNWRNVKKAITNLKKAKVLTPAKLHALSVSTLAQLIKPSGYFNVKAKRLKHFLNFLFAEYKGKLGLMAQEDLIVLRGKLLNVNGIGPETADSILLYAFNQPIFVVDAYTKRFMSRHQWIEPAHDYHDVQNIFHELSLSDAHFVILSKAKDLGIDSSASPQNDRSVGVQNKDSKVKYFNEYHALIVRLAKDFCRTKAVCEGCPLNKPKFWKSKG